MVVSYSHNRVACTRFFALHGCELPSFFLERGRLYKHFMVVSYSHDLVSLHNILCSSIDVSCPPFFLERGKLMSLVTYETYETYVCWLLL